MIYDMVNVSSSSEVRSREFYRQLVYTNSLITFTKIHDNKRAVMRDFTDSLKKQFTSW